MRNLLLFLAMLLIITSCRKDDNGNVGMDNLLETLTGNQFEVGSFIEDGVDRTNEFNVIFTFGQDRACSYGGVGYTVKTKYSAWAEGDKFYFRFCYSDKPPLNAIAKTWEVNAIEDWRVSLSHTNDSTGTLTTMTLDNWDY